MAKDRGTSNKDKGTDGEEAVLEFFHQTGYYCVRGCVYSWDAEDITDVDVFLYGKMSPVSRERVNVDIKYKRTPQAAERILFARGLQVALAFDRAIVVTTDDRPWLEDLAKASGVTLLGGKFIKRLAGSYRTGTTRRLSPEALRTQLKEQGTAEAKALWADYEAAKRGLLAAFGFPLCIDSLAISKRFAEVVVLERNRSEIALRLMYAVIGIFCASLDYAIRDMVILESGVDIRIGIAAGLRYGPRGKPGFDQDVQMATALVEAYLSDGRERASELRRSVNDAIGALRIEELAEYFERPSVYRELFSLAREFDAAAFSERLVGPDDLPAPAKAMLGLIVDHHDIPREKLFEAGDAAAKLTHDRSKTPASVQTTAQQKPLL